MHTQDLAKSSTSRYWVQTPENSLEKQPCCFHRRNPTNLSFLRHCLHHRGNLSSYSAYKKGENNSSNREDCSCCRHRCCLQNLLGLTSLNPSEQVSEMWGVKLVFWIDELIRANASGHLCHQNWFNRNHGNKKWKKHAVVKSKFYCIS